MQTPEEPRVLPLPGASRERQHLPRQACGGDVFRYWVLREPRWLFLLPQPWEVGPGSPPPFHRGVHRSSEPSSSAVKVIRWQTAEAGRTLGRWTPKQTQLPRVPSGARGPDLVCRVGC